MTAKKEEPVAEQPTLTVGEYLAARRAWLEAEQLRIEGALKEVKNAQALLKGS